ncbi:MAG: zinc-ribbon domain-containing protein [Oscillospiraceae bacterium]|nr:zinc-ribbon domain-containing protein [Oscillospiraceae bacterium]
MITCMKCGAQHPDNYTQCPNCGNLLQQPIPAQPTYNGYIPPAYQEAPTTSVGAWFGWYLLCAFLPIIGAIILLNVSKDPSVKNFAKLNIILSIIGLVVGILMFMLIFSMIRSYIM